MVIPEETQADQTAVGIETQDRKETLARRVARTLAARPGTKATLAIPAILKLVALVGRRLVQIMARLVPVGLGIAHREVTTLATIQDLPIQLHQVSASSRVLPLTPTSADSLEVHQDRTGIWDRRMAVNPRLATVGLGVKKVEAKKALALLAHPIARLVANHRKQTVGHQSPLSSLR